MTPPPPNRWRRTHCCSRASPQELSRALLVQQERCQALGEERQELSQEPVLAQWAQCRGSVLAQWARCRGSRQGLPLGPAQILGREQVPSLEQRLVLGRTGPEPRQGLELPEQRRVQRRELASAQVLRQAPEQRMGTVRIEGTGCCTNSKNG